MSQYKVLQQSIQYKKLKSESHQNFSLQKFNNIPKNHQVTQSQENNVVKSQEERSRDLRLHSSHETGGLFKF